jgi:hypothetical protein
MQPLAKDNRAIVLDQTAGNFLSQLRRDFLSRRLNVPPLYDRAPCPDEAA